MKKSFWVPVCALACAAALTLTGCAAMLNREYSSSSSHVEYPVSSKAPILQAENYQGLVNAILYFVSEHEETGLIHLSSYPGDMEGDLDAACEEVRTEDPLAAYAVEEIGHTYSYVSSYCEVAVSIRYAHTPEEVAAIVPAVGSTAIRQTISSAMTAFSEQCVLRVNYFTGDAASLEQLAWQTWLDTPLAALTRPKIHVDLYPDSGTSRIVKVTLTWPLTPSQLAERSAALEQRALALLEGLETPPEERTLEELLEALQRAALYDPLGGGTAYDALVDGAGNDRGIALALRLLCQLADLTATVAEGSVNEEPRYWLIVSTAEGYRHLDPTVREPAYATDDEFLALGYVWEPGRYPACTDYAAAGQAGDPGDNPADTGEETDTGMEAEPSASG